MSYGNSSDYTGAPSQGSFSDPVNQGQGFQQFQGFQQNPAIGQLLQQFMAKARQQGLSQQQTMSSLAQAIQKLQMGQVAGSFGTSNNYGSDAAMAAGQSSVFGG